jgi:hypothetical protein
MEADVGCRVDMHGSVGQWLFAWDGLFEWICADIAETDDRICEYVQMLMLM